MYFERKKGDTAVSEHGVIVMKMKVACILGFDVVGLPAGLNVHMTALFPYLAMDELCVGKICDKYWARIGQN